MLAMLLVLLVKLAIWYAAVWFEEPKQLDDVDDDELIGLFWLFELLLLEALIDEDEADVDVDVELAIWLLFKSKKSKSDKAIMSSDEWVANSPVVTFELNAALPFRAVDVAKLA